MAQLTVEQTFQAAVQHHQAGRLPQAEHLYRQILTRRPNHADAMHNLGLIAYQVGRYQIAIELIRRALALNRNNPQAHFNLGVALGANGQVDDAIASYRQAIALKANYPEAYTNLGNALKDAGRLDEAIAACRQAVTQRPSFAEALSNLGNALQARGRVDEAIAVFRQAIAINPDLAMVQNNLGNALKDNGQLDEAITAFRRAIALDPGDSVPHSNLLYLLCFHPGYDARANYQEHSAWDRQHGEPLRKLISPHSNDRDPERRLRIGYVSPDFREQAESFFTIPLLESHDHAGFEIACYSSAIKPDEITRRIAASADVWREVRGETDESLARIIRADGIDVLVDLTMHMARGRPLLFARKPAPVQLCWLAYPGTTGLPSIDYRITDAFMDPVDADDSVYAEKSVRLPDCWVVYDPLCDIAPRPPEQSGSITFGSLNNPCKLNDSLLTLWAKVLEAVPQSHLMLLAGSADQRGRILRLMAGAGIAADRLSFAGPTARPDYLRSYDRIDIALDTLPYNGITTTCDALYMGTPVLTLAGETAAGRAGKAMLAAIGLPELAAGSADEFVRRCGQLAHDIPRLVELRRGLRQRLMQSPLMDAPRFARNMEAAYRKMWRTWCASAAPGGR